MTELVFKRKFRWTLSGQLPGGEFKETFVKIAARPNCPIEETEIDYLSSKMFIPNKPAWEQITATTYDTENIDWTVLGSAFPSEKVPLKSQKKYRNIEEPFEISYSDDISQILSKEEKKEILGEFSLKLYDGCGSLIEEWALKDACISAVNAEEEYVELTIKYKQTEYINHCNYSFAPAPSTLTPSINTSSSKHNMGLGMLGSPDIVFK